MKDNTAPLDVYAYITNLDIQYDKAYTITMAAHGSYGESVRTGSILVFVPITKEPANLSASLAQDADGNPIYTDVNLFWTPPEDTSVTGYKLYVGTDEITISPDDCSNVTVDGVDMLKYTYSGCSVNNDYIFRVSALYAGGVESKVTKSAFVSTHEAVPAKPDVVVSGQTVPTNDSERVSLTVNVTGDEADTAPFDFYNLYINGEKVNNGNTSNEVIVNTGIYGTALDAFDKNTQTFELSVPQGMTSLIKMSRQNGQTEGALSDAVAVTANTFIDPSLDLTNYPPQVDVNNINVSYVFKDEANNVLQDSDNTHISWNPVSGVENESSDPSYYLVFIDSQTDGVKYTDPAAGAVFSFTPGSEHAIQIQAVREDSGNVYDGKKSGAKYIKTPEPTYSAPDIVDASKVTTKYNKDTSEISFTFPSSGDSDVYYIFFNGGNQINDKFTALDNGDGTVTVVIPNIAPEKNYTFQIAAAKDYDGQEIMSDKSDLIDVSTKEEEEEDKQPTAFQNNPVINRSITDSLSRGTIYWNAPAKGADEIGDLAGFHIWFTQETDDSGIPINFKKLTQINDGVESDVTILPSHINSFGEYSFELTNVIDNVYLKVEAFKFFGSSEVHGAQSNIWTLRTDCNTLPKADYDDSSLRDNPDSFQNVTNKDANGDGTRDEQRRSIKIRGFVNLEAKVTLYDKYDQVVASTDANGEFTLEAELDSPKTADVITLADDTASSNGYTLTVTKDCSTSYVITDIEVGTDVNEINLNNVTLYLGELTNDGVINVDDMLIVNNNYNKSGASNLAGDVNGDGVVNVDDLLLVNNNFSKSSTQMTYAEFIAD